MASKPKFVKRADRLIAAGLELPPLLNLALAGQPVALSLAAYNECDRWAADHGFDSAQAKLLHQVVAGVAASNSYLRTLAQHDSTRFDLRGMPTSPVSVEHRTHARQELAERKTKARAGRARAEGDPGASTDEERSTTQRVEEKQRERQPVTHSSTVTEKPDPGIDRARLVAPHAASFPVPRAASAPVSALKPAPQSLPLPNGPLINHAFHAVVRRRNSAALIRIWSTKGLKASIDAEREAVLRDVAAELRREGFGFPPVAERQVDGRYADLVVEHRRRA